MSLVKETQSAQLALNTQQANLLDGVAKEKALLEANLENIDLQKQQYIERTNEVIFGLESIEGKEEELNQIYEAREVRLAQFTQERINRELEGNKSIKEAQEEANKEQDKRDKKKAEDAEKEHQKKKDRLAEQTQMFATVTQEFTNLGELGVQLFERFGEKNKKNAEIAFK